MARPLPGYSAERGEHAGASTGRERLPLRNLSNLAYYVKNLQVTAFLQDPQDHTRLTPLATLLPAAEPTDGYALGALDGDRGPFILTSTTIFPNLVENLRANPTGLIFRISNYDIVSESGRNFPFASQAVAERTASLSVDYGGFDSNGDGDGVGDETE